MPGMKVTLSTAMRVRDVSKPLPHQEDEARAKVAEWPASTPRPLPPLPARSRPGGASEPGPWRQAGERVEGPTSRAGGHRKGGGRPTPQASRGTDQRPPAPGQGGAGQRPERETGPAPRSAAPERGVGSDNQPGPARRKRVRRRRKGGSAAPPRRKRPLAPGFVTTSYSWPGSGGRSPDRS